MVLFTGCSKDPDNSNLKPKLTISSNIEVLSVTLIGSATDADGTINSLTIDWGDSIVDKYVNNDFTTIKIAHTFTLPAAYTIWVTAKDNNGDSTILSVPVAVDFKETYLDGIKESMFKTSANEFLILTLNLHTYQETQQNEKFNLITDVIGKMDVDFIAFQECAQNKSTAISSGIIRNDNMALVISDRLKAKYNKDYNFAWNWAHYGWNVWEEGVAVLSRYPLVDSEDRYISSGTGTANITSRKVIYGSYQVPGGRFNLFSAHTHWRTSLTDEEQNNQVKKIQLMVSEKEAAAPGVVSFVCGDFNGNPTSDYPWSEGYNTMMKDDVYSDTFRAVYPEANTKPAQSKYYTVGGELPGRIDYIFAKKDPRINVIDSQIIFTSSIVGNVSDHFGVLTKVNITR